MNCTNGGGGGVGDIRIAPLHFVDNVVHMDSSNCNPQRALGQFVARMRV